MNDHYNLDPKEARAITGAGVNGFLEDQGGASSMLRNGDTEGIENALSALRPHITAEDIERARRLNEAAERIAAETGLPFEEARIRLFEELERQVREKGEEK